MSSSTSTPHRPQETNKRPPMSPTSPDKPRLPFLVPSPVPMRRNRTQSMSERAAAGPTHRGKVESFCREKGHGFIVPSKGGEHLFVHISDVDGEYIPKAGDDVTYKECPIPPKFERISAVHVSIVNFDPDTHLRWDSPIKH